MDFHPGRLRSGELIVGASAVALLVSTFALSWYGLKARLVPTAAQLGSSTSSTGWNSLTHVRWLVLLTIIVALALVFFQGARRAPAIPTALSVIITVLAILTLLALIYRVLISTPGSGNPTDLKPGAYVGLLSALALTYGGYLSMRQEGLAESDAPQRIETVRLRGIRES